MEAASDVDSNDNEGAHKRVLQQAFMQRAVLHKDDPVKSEEDAAAAAAYGHRLARMMTAEVGVLPCALFALASLP